MIFSTEEHYHDDKEMRAMKGTDNSRQKVVNELKTELSLVDLLFRELALYKKACVSAKAALENGKYRQLVFWLFSLKSVVENIMDVGPERIDDVDFNNAVLEGRYPHLKQVLPPVH